MVSTCARTVRVVNIQASEATTSAITSVVMCSMLPAMIDEDGDGRDRQQRVGDDAG